MEIVAFGLFPISACKVLYWGWDERKEISSLILRDEHSEALEETLTIVTSYLLSHIFIGVIRNKTAQLIMADVIFGG